MLNEILPQTLAAILKNDQTELVKRCQKELRDTDSILIQEVLDMEVPGVLKTTSTQTGAHFKPAARLRDTITVGESLELVENPPHPILETELSDDAGNAIAYDERNSEIHKLMSRLIETPGMRKELEIWRQKQGSSGDQKP